MSLSAGIWLNLSHFSRLGAVYLPKKTNNTVRKFILIISLNLLLSKLEIVLLHRHQELSNICAPLLTSLLSYAVTTQSWISHHLLSPVPSPSNHSCFSISSASITNVSVVSRALVFGPLRCRASLESPYFSPKTQQCPWWSDVDLNLYLMYSLGGSHNSDSLVGTRIQGTLLSCCAREKELEPPCSFSAPLCSFTPWGSRGLAPLAWRYSQHSSQRSAVGVSDLVLQPGFRLCRVLRPRWTSSSRPSRSDWCRHLTVYQLTSVLEILPAVTSAWNAPLVAQSSFMWLAPLPTVTLSPSFALLGRSSHIIWHHVITNFKITVRDDTQGFESCSSNYSH